MGIVRYISWEAEELGITFNLSQGRITIFKKTLEVINFPEYYHFLFNPEDRMFAIQACSMDDNDAHRLSVDMNRKFRCEVKSMSLVRFVYQTCGWKEKRSYRIQGRVEPEKQLVRFDLKSGLQIYQGRLMSCQICEGKIIPLKLSVR